MGRSKALQFLSYYSTPTRFVKVNVLNGGEEKVLMEVSNSGVILTKVSDFPFLYTVTQGAGRLIGQAAYAKGLLSFQDIPSCLSSLLGSPRSGYFVLNVGFGSISSTVYLAQLMNNTGKILSIDSSAHRMKVLAIEAERANIDIVEPVVVETSKMPSISGKADLVILSPMCSNTGIFWRAPSLKWNVDFKRIKDSADVQSSMINNYADYVKHGGSLVYWTRSITVEENELLIERFLKLHPEFSLVAAKPRVGVLGLREQNECQRLYPYIHGADGSYFARLIKHE